MLRRFRRTSLAALFLAALAPGCGTEPAGDPAVSVHAGGQESKAYVEALAMVEAKRQEILPSPAERRWEEIEFLPSYAGGLKTAAEQQKPLMLWVMNGHPLGCT